MSDNLMDKVNALGERLKISGAEVSRKMSVGVSNMSFKMKELFQGQNMADKVVDEATLEAMDAPDWAINLEICDMVNTERVNSVEVIRAIKRRIMLKNPRVQYLSLVLLETIVKNCEKAFSEIAAERVLDEMVKLIDDPQTIVNNRNKALMLIEAWGESGDDLRYLPVYEETYKSLRSRGIRFPGRDDESLAPIFSPRSVPAAEPYSVAAQEGYQEIPDESFAPVRAVPAVQVNEAFEVARNSVELLSTVLSSSPPKEVLEDDLTTTLVQQCQQCQYTIQRIVETAGDNEAQLFEALSIHEELQKVQCKYEELKEPVRVEHEPEPAMIPVTVELEESPRTVSKEDAPARKPTVSGYRSNGDDLLQDIDDMIFGKKGGTSSQQDRTPRKEQKDDFISF
ncbi:TOM1-like protein 1 [Phragmites australis]|uniref:TOM1-like protein 1 n=1 Tax=Phragmites australis TaxID=29695 RepID=UPI002D77B8F7|nr:TOM1-like protein 1 [Phragmites australis]XP_062205701.1 TOM1-like protein 1 [Phragmites australis]XP_062205704.1 TOM1-like protein 1 [Phragmites australis]